MVFDRQTEAALDRAAELICQADSLIITAGAGMGADSGLPDFRGAEGFWKAYPALRSSGLDFFEIANPSAFEQHPRLAWGFYGHRLALYRQTEPHAGFAHLLRWGELKHKGYWVFTSNVDGQFQKAGFTESRLHECHGSIHHLQCGDGCGIDIWSAADFAPKVDEQRSWLLNEPPLCPNCRAVARPNILMFDDYGWQGWRAEGQKIRQERWLTGVQRPMVIELGAGTATPSVRRFGERIVKDFRSHLIRINQRESQMGVTPGVGIQAGALEALEALAARLP